MLRALIQRRARKRLEDSVERENSEPMQGGNLHGTFCLSLLGKDRGVKSENFPIQDDPETGVDSNTR
jgi:hypothetical protein